MICDAHIHVGQFRDLYTSSADLIRFLDKVEVDKFAVSSTTIWEEDYPKILREIEELIHLAGNRVCPVLWISPAMLDNGGIEEFLNHKIDWRCIKVHGVHPWTTENIYRCVEIARRLAIPLLFHTGGYEQCEAKVYAPIAMANKDVTFVLAHARPIEQALAVMKACPNVYADTAFTPMDAVKQLIDEGFASRVLFGTDYPLQRVFYPNTDISAMYQKQIEDTQTLMTTEQWELVSHLNFEKLYQ